MPSNTSTPTDYAAARAAVVVCLIAALSVVAYSNVADASEPVASRSLDQELPRIPPVDAVRAPSTLEVQAGFRMELFAAEPLVASPVDACFDEQGRMYVAEMRDYPFSWEPTKLNPKGGGKKDAGVVRLLEDTDGDGKADRSTVFADKLTWPTSVCCYRGGVFVLAPPHLHYFKDTNGDGVADVREIVLTGFGRDNVQAIANNLKWSLDNRIVFAAGRDGGKLLFHGKPVFSIHGQDIALKPDPLELEAMTGGDQFGLSFDDWGNRFVCNNSNHIEQIVFEDRYVRRNPYFAVTGAIETIAKEGPAAPVFRRSPPEPWRIVRTRRRVSDPAMLRTLPETERHAIGFFTSAAGVTIYRGDAYPPEFRGNAFIGDVGGNLVHRKIVSREGSHLVATRADQNVEFIASTDNWFRPVNFVNGPDGNLYVLDMYRETIEHPFSIPDDIKAHLDLQSGDNRGRIYRLMAPGSKRRPVLKLGHLATADLVGQLASTNAWNRETAQRLIVEYRERRAIPALRELALHSPSALGRLHAMYTLVGLDALADEVISALFTHPEPRLRAHAIRLAESRLRNSGPIAEAWGPLLHDPDPLVRFQLALSLGESGTPDGGLAVLATRARDDRRLQVAILTAVAHNADQVALKLISSGSSASREKDLPFLAELAQIVGANPMPQIAGADPNDSPARVLIHGILAVRNDPACQLALLRGLGHGLSQRGSSFVAVLADRGTDDATRAAVARLFTQAAVNASSQTDSDSKRVAAIGLLAFAPFDQAGPVLASLLTPQTSPALQSAAVAAFASQTHADVGKQLLAGWKGFGPQIRRDVIDALVRTPARVDVLFDAIASNRVGRAEIDRDVKQVLINHRNRRIRDRARAILDAEMPGDRRKIVNDYLRAADGSGQAGEGRTIYEKRCSICHRAGSAGHIVGPDLASVQNKSPADLLVAILDPNREAQPNYVAYSVVTNQGTVHNGLIAAESAAAITLRRAEGKEDQILRSQIDEIASTGKSLMPDGFEKEISVDQMRNVIAFIKSLAPAAPAATR